MEKEILFIGLDVDDNLFHGCGYQGRDKEIIEFKSKPNLGSLIEKLECFRSDGYELKICYEATYLGYSLQRGLKKKGYECEIIAPSLIPEVAGDKVKTDKTDCRKLAAYYAQGNLTPVHIPDEEEETRRDLIRSRKFIQEQISRLKKHITSLCRRMGLNYRADMNKTSGVYWTQRHRDWLSKQININNYSSLKLNLSLLLNELSNLETSLNLYDEEIEKLAASDKYQEAVKALCCYRGISTLTALSLILEIGDIKRFDHPRRLTSYAGMDLIEYSSGGKERRYGISKMGNRYIRTSAIESCQNVYNYPRVHPVLKRRRQGVDIKLIEIADRGMKRLYKKSNMLLYRGKPINKVKVACARELLCFVWESLRAAA